jgi:hypothetical protein
MNRRLVRSVRRAEPDRPGALTANRCGHPTCRCHADPPRLHGPYHQWTRKKDGKTVTRILSDDQLADYQPWFDNQRRLRALITELETLSQEIADNDPRWNRQATKTNVGTQRLTRGRPPRKPQSGQLRPKREDLATKARGSFSNREMAFCMWIVYGLPHAPELLLPGSSRWQG